ncbi:hypothetical protein B7P33_06035 [Sediminicola luteus]|uniref:Uncharacterized protein n=2 Tax=Sediminicola luteus TaxID=319238 RepID=A0A2A4G9S8_9FLAO|nr:hypothetical protein B7P33_06035 [Sediminicola luteus]
MGFSQKTYSDKAFKQDQATKFQKTTDAALRNLAIDRNGVVQVLSSQGVLHPWEKELKPQLQYRPISDQKVLDMVAYQGQFVYLTDTAILSNAWAGKLYWEHGLENPTQLALGADFTMLVANKENLRLAKNGKVLTDIVLNAPVEKMVYDAKGARFVIATAFGVYTLGETETTLTKIYAGEGITSLAVSDKEVLVGTQSGYLTLNLDGKEASPLQAKLPWPEITSVQFIDGEKWLGSTKGAFKLRSDGKFDYYASKRWLTDDKVVAIEAGPEGSVLVLTETGLSQIDFTPMTLHDKAMHFQKVQRQRHIRYGFSSATRLQTPGDLSSAILWDTDNDGLWTSMYLAGELFRYAATKSEDAKLNAYEAFEAMERLTKISKIDGFPARTYEIDTYQSSDREPDKPEHEKIWRLTDDKRWRWKSTTSSDESCGHFFVYALFAELAPDKSWRDRAIHQLKIEMDHLIENDWYLVTWNGKPTQWGRWNPDYVNQFPINVGDRRLNSTLILSFLQTTYHFTKDKKYLKHYKKLANKFGYEENANRPASVIGFVEGQYLSSAWNHSDDEMYFLTIPGYVNYAFDEESKAKHFEAAKSHWEIERNEKNPLWNFLYAMIGGTDYDLDESIWWLKEFPMDLIDWKVENAHRKDLDKVAKNFRKQEYSEVLPRDERPMHLHNNAYRNNGGSDGQWEHPAYIYLLPYWAGRYVGAISAPEE